MSLRKMLVLTESEVRRCLSMKDCLEINRKALMSVSGAASQVSGRGEVPPRLGLPGPPRAPLPGAPDDWTLFKPAAFYGDSTNARNTDTTTKMGLKIVSIRAQNPSAGLPLVPATIMVLDAVSGIVQGVLSGTYLTGARTAASSGLATQLCRPDLHHLVVFGAGLQAECHIDAIQTAVGRIVPKITLVNRGRERAESLKEKILQSNSGSVCEIDIVLLNDEEGIHKALATADVVAATTNTTTPLFDGSVLPPGCHINGIGSYTPDMHEIPVAAVNRSSILIDTVSAKSVGDLKHLDEHHPMTLLGDALGASSWSRRDDCDLTFYKGVGTAIQDVLTADLVMKRARELGIGTEVDMG